MSKAKYIHVINGNKVTEEQFNKMSEVEQSYYDSVSSIRKAKAAVAIESFEEEE